MEKGLVSVVIPTYNRAGTIERAIDSVLGQDYPVIEVIVIDDGSKDDTPDIISRKYSKDKRVRYFHFINGGVCVARNSGIQKVRGEFIAMLDSDDYWLPGKLSLQINILNAHPTLSMIWSDIDAINTMGQVVAKKFLRTMYSNYQNFSSLLDIFETESKTENDIPYYIGNIAKVLVTGNIVHTSTVVARTECILKAGEYDQSVHPSEDQDFYYRLCLTGPVALVDTITIYYQIGADDAASGKFRNYELATSALKVFNRLRKLESNDFRIPKELLEKKETQLYEWVGKASLYKGRMAEARRYLMKRIIRSPFEIHSFLYFVISCMPFPVKFLHFAQKLKNKRPGIFPIF